MSSSLAATFRGTTTSTSSPEAFNICNLLAGLVISDPSLSNAKRQVPLKSVKAHALINDMTALVTIEQEYFNESEHPVDVKYMFPLEEGAAVASFEATIGNTTVKAIVKEKEEAKATYDKAIAEKKTAALMEKTADDVFITHIGNLDKLQSCTIKLSYVTELSLTSAGGKTVARFILPTVVAPRYAPHSTSSTSTTSSVRRQVGSSLPYRLLFGARITAPSKIVQVGCPSGHLIHGRYFMDESDGESKSQTSQQGSTTCDVNFGQDEAVLDKDIVLHIEQEHPFETRSLIECVDGEDVAMQLTFCPSVGEQDAMTLANEIIIIVDRSGSMGGPRIRQVQGLLPILLRSLPPVSKFNIIGFGSSVDKLFAASADYTDENLDKAMTHVTEKMNADLGGTELLTPLNDALSKPVLPGMPRQVFLLTDGEVENSDECINKVAQYAHTCRVWTFGIGNSVSTSLVKSIARAGHGEAEFISDDEKVGDKVMLQLQRALQPALTNVTVDWSTLRRPDVPIASDGGACAITQCPHALPPLFSGSRYFAYGLNLPPVSHFKDEGEILVKACPNNATEGKAVSVVIRVPFKKSLVRAVKKEQSIVHRLAARARIRELELKEAMLPSATPRWGEGDMDDDESSQVDSSADERKVIKNEMVYYGTNYNLASRHTSFVAVFEQSHVSGTDDKKQLIVPLAAPTQVLDEDDPAAESCHVRGAKCAMRSRGRRGTGCGMAMAAAASFSFGAPPALSSPQMDMDLDDLVYRGTGSSSSPSETDKNTASLVPLNKEPTTQCFFNTTGTTFAEMDAYECFTCYLTLARSKLCCRACSLICHKGHSVKFAKRLKEAFCDCGENKTLSTKCQCLTPEQVEPILLNKIIQGQRVNGSWKDDAALLEVLNECQSLSLVASIDDMRSSHAKAMAEAKDDEWRRTILATRLALALLHTRFASSQSKWKLMANKAQAFLKTEMAKVSSGPSPRFDFLIKFCGV